VPKKRAMKYLALFRKYFSLGLGWLLLSFGLLLYIKPLFYDVLGFNSGLIAFLLIFIGITLLKYRKDQLN
jgi:hypothetical protein